MNHDLFDAELEAIQSLQNLIEVAKECRRLHERANMPIPEPLRRLFAMNGQGDRTGVALIKPPETPPRPRRAESNWIHIHVKDAYATTLAIALLRDRDAPMRPKDVVNSVQMIRPEISRGSIYNLGKRLDGAMIKRVPEGWILLNHDNAPIIQGDLVWGHPEMFTPHELAAHRRDAILHILGIYPSGQQTSQLIDLLQNCSWLQAPVNKELVQDDVELLSKDGKIKRRGASKKWELVKSEKN